MEWSEGIWHVWLFALGMAALAPWCVQMYARAIERRVKRETEATLARARALSPVDPSSSTGASTATPDDAEHRTEH